MTRRATAAILIAVALVSLVVVAGIDWLGEEPFAAELVSQEFTFVPDGRGGVDAALSVDGKVLRRAAEVRLGDDRKWPRAPGAVRLEQLDLLPPDDPGCGALTVGLGRRGPGRSLLRLVARSEAGRGKGCRAPWQLIVGVGQEIPEVFPIPDGEAVEVIFQDPAPPAYVLGAFTAAALRSGQLLRVSGADASPQVLATGARMSGRIEVLRVVAELAPGGDGALALATRVFAPSSAKVTFSGYEPRRHRILQRVVPAIGLAAGAVGFAIQLLGVSSLERCARRRRLARAAKPANRKAGPASPAPTDGGDHGV